MTIGSRLRPIDGAGHMPGGEFAAVAMPRAQAIKLICGNVIIEIPRQGAAELADELRRALEILEGNNRAQAEKWRAGNGEI